MNHNQIANGCVKYLNLILGILMLVVLSLHLESILHSKTHEHLEFEFDKRTFWSHLGIQYDQLSKDFIHNCNVCHKTALEVLISFNIKGALIAFFLAGFSFLFAFKLEVYLEYYLIFVPLSILTALTTTAYFIFIYMYKSQLPAICLDERIERNCDADFTYQIEYKILPYSFLMLVLVPQFLARSTELIFVKLCLNKKTYVYESKYSLKKKPRIFNIDEFNPDIDHSGFRELPVDCPSTVFTLKMPTPNFDINNNENKGFIDNQETYQKHHQTDDFIEQTESQELVADILNNSQLPINFSNRRTFVKSTSLSTIAEEKTLNTQAGNSLTSRTNKLTDQSSASESSSSIDGRFMIQKLLSEFQSKNTFISEIINVFEPSSKMGNFNRNVPIRFSSPLKHNKEKVENSQTSLSLTSLCTGSTESPQSDSSGTPQKTYNDILLKNLINSGSSADLTSKSPNNWFGNMLVAKKMRLVKRLKNRIEAKTGQKLQSTKQTMSLDFKIRHTLNQSNDSISLNTSPYNLRRNHKSKRNLVFDAVADTIDEPVEVLVTLQQDTANNTQSDHVEINPYQNATDYKTKGGNIYENNNNSNVFLNNQSLVINTSVEPVYF